ncbi:MAG TPA: hypothetical protein VGV16_06150 [Gammaproteobacteria bacterium]|nr:hypothetical protein [Gammaproteobacteria bacterium]
MKIQTLLFTALLGLACSAAFGATPAPAAGSHTDSHGMCAQSQDQCTELAAKFDQWCSANADKCTAMKAHMEKRREWCEQNKDKCEKMMRRMRDRHHGDEDEDKDKGGDDDDQDGGGNP